jgi:hypothetical protein
MSTAAPQGDFGKVLEKIRDSADSCRETPPQEDHQV